MAVSVGAVQSYIEGEFGGPTSEQDAESTVGVSAVKLLGNDPERLALTIINLGTEDVWVMYDDKVSTTRGIRIHQGGGLLSMNVRDDQTLPSREWYALTSAASTDVVTIETRRYALT